MPADQILTVAQMRAAEEALMVGGVDVHTLMARAGQGAADYVWRLAGHRRVTVLAGPGNNGGDGYFLAEALRQRGGRVMVVAPHAPRGEAALRAAGLYGGELQADAAGVRGDVLVDCLYGSGLTRPLRADDKALLVRLAAGHPQRIAVDVPSGIACDSGAVLGEDLPDYQLTLALGAWKFAHFLMPATARMGALRCVDIGAGACEGAGHALRRPHFAAPSADAHKYRRGLLAVVGGPMPGAAVLAARAAQGAGAGYVKLLAKGDVAVPADLVAERADLAGALADPRLSAVLVGPGLGRDTGARARLALALAAGQPLVVDADALMLLGPEMLAGGSGGPAVATPHEGELAAMERAFGLGPAGAKSDRAQALAAASGLVIVAKGPDTVIAAPDGRLACAPRATSWLSTAGTGDVLAGTVASRLACGREAFAAACEGVWLHAEAARIIAPPFAAEALALAIPAAYRACLQ